MGNEMTYIPMEDDLKSALRDRYYAPLGGNIILTTAVAIIFYLVVVLGADSAAVNGVIKLTGKGSTSYISESSFCFWLAVGIVIVYIFCIFNFCSMNVHFKQDAEFGQIVKEKVHITSAYETPMGYNIYWLDSESILSFTPEPYRHFYVGDVATIYYLKFSKEYLAYEV
ncbi:hypothetical protein [Taibaiella soli]|uniref:DUF3592 domain-containing protein n=1 Tax=Taibaiella soli TaxID=1649169 RepID=A0A2W2B805_9BACT|nr:hypothetical protein [Taibaiella soli]PZF72409.1 hypothetical protein DN068_13735 [Taibaiella soli]